MPLEPLLPLHVVAPSWTARDATGQPFTLFKPRGRAHTLLMVGAPEAELAGYLAEFAPQLAELGALPARGVAVLGSQAGSERLAPWTILTDDTGQVQRTYLPPGAIAGVFILDRYNELYKQWIAASPRDLPPVAEAVEWLEAIGCDCGI